MTDVPRGIRAIIGVIALVVIASLVLGWWGDYRGERALDRDASAEETVTPDATEGDAAGDNGDPPPAEEPQEPAEGTRESAVGTGQTVVVGIEGLSFRRGPSRDAERISTLHRGTRLEHLATENGWYRVRATDGTEGYVSASEQYTELQ